MENKTHILLRDENGVEAVSPEKGLLFITGFLMDEKGQIVSLTDLTTLTLTVSDRDGSKSVINGIQALDIKNTGRGQVFNKQAITGASNASPIAITIVAHGHADGDRVWVTGVGGNSNANGRWRVTVTGADTFSLNGSTGNGAYTSGGSCIKAAAITLQGADHTLADTAKSLEYHTALVEGTYGGSKPLKYSMDYAVEKLDKVS